MANGEKIEFNLIPRDNENITNLKLMTLERENEYLKENVNKSNLT